MSEHNDQCTFVDYVLWTYRNRNDFVRPLLFSVPNGAWLGGMNERGDFRGRVMQRLKAEGFTPGVADILYLQPRGGFAYLAIEMKTHARAKESKGGMTIEQMDFIKAAIDAGAKATVCYGADQAMLVFDEYMKLPIPAEVKS